jgi:hypothetical protein
VLTEREALVRKNLARVARGGAWSSRGWRTGASRSDFVSRAFVSQRDILCVTDPIHRRHWLHAPPSLPSPWVQARLPPRARIARLLPQRVH